MSDKVKSEDAGKGYCPESEDGDEHCYHWWEDGKRCCWCGHPGSDRDEVDAEGESKDSSTV